MARNQPRVGILTKSFERRFSQHTVNSRVDLPGFPPQPLPGMLLLSPPRLLLLGLTAGRALVLPSAGQTTARTISMQAEPPPLRILVPIATGERMCQHIYTAFNSRLGG